MNFYRSEINRILSENFSPFLLPKIVGSKKFIDQHFESPLSLETIASTSFLSKYHFARSFKRLYGRTPLQYLQEKRITRAKELLLNNHSVTDACLSIGLESVTSFSIAFKKQCGVSPANFKKQQDPIALPVLNFSFLMQNKKESNENKTDERNRR